MPLPSWRPLRTPVAQLAKEIKELATEVAREPDESLRTRFSTLRARVQQGGSCEDDLALRALGPLVLEAIRRRIGVELYDVQLEAGIVMARGGIAEMATGEGKTLAAALPASAWALTENGVHVATVNQFLAERDWTQLWPVYALLGMTCQLLPERALVSAKRDAYQADITYASGYELGFDYLRDQAALGLQPDERLGDRFLGTLRGLATDSYSPIQCHRGMCIVDEIDSVLIDEARTPLVLSQDAGEKDLNEAAAIRHARDVALRLVVRRDYTLERRKKRVELTPRGHAAMKGTLPPNWGLRRPWAVYVMQALRAEYLLDLDVHYVVANNEIRLVDEFTGRIFDQRVLKSGLHQAVQVKEGLDPTTENSTLARICRQRYFGLYDRLCGMTGTAMSARHEFRKFFELRVETIPLNRPSRRQMLPTRFFSTQEAKFAAIVEDVVIRHAQGQPILIGSRTIRNSQRIAELLSERGLPRNLLNGQQDLAEAETIARAGRRGTITVATNMAGRGTDIRLEPGVAEQGGLHVVGVERHESRRIDQQLAGRCARQGDPGTCQFFVSAEDDLIRLHAPRFAQWLRKRPGAGGEVYGNLSTKVDRLQRQLERRQALEREELLRDDERLNRLLAQAAGIRTGS